jgi:polyhydroxyalkanoate synthase
VDREEVRSFRKEIVVTSSLVPLAMVRKRAADAAGGVAETRAPVLLVHGFGQNRYAWHLPARSFANHLAAAGFDVFNLDLRGHGRSRHFGSVRSHGVEDYVREDLPAAVAEVQALSGKRPVWVVGHSLGGLVGYASAPQLDGAVAGIVSIGSPYHFTRGSLTLGALTYLFRGLALAPVRNAPLPLATVALTIRFMRRFAESPPLSAPPARVARGLDGAARPRAAPGHGLRPRGDGRDGRHVRLGGAAPLRGARARLRRAVRGDGHPAARRRWSRTTTSPRRRA